MSHRTTLTLDDDVAARLEREARRSGRPYREVVNAALRRGLGSPPEAGLEPYRVSVRQMRRRPGIEIDDVRALLDLLDGPGSV